MKKLLAIIMSFCVALTAFIGTGCVGTKGSNSPNVLDVYCYVSGYGDTYLTNSAGTGVLDIFTEQDWVKAKYPNVKVSYTSNGEAGFANNKLYNQKSNTFDLIFSNWLDAIPQSLVVNLTDAVYKKEVPGKEDTKIIDILPEHVRESIRRDDVENNRTDGYEDYFSVRYLSEFFSFMYNKDVLDFYDIELPVTTKEFEEACETVEKSVETHTATNPTAYTYKVGTQSFVIDTGLMMSAKNSYIQWMFPAFWTQYEGIQNYRNFFEGEYFGELSTENFYQKGRLRAFQTMEDLVREHHWEGAAEANNTEAQNEFILGNGLFHWNGDYFTTEMVGEREQNRDKYGVEDNIGMMAIPVMSSLVEKLSFYVEDTGSFVEAERAGTTYLTSTEKPYHMLDETKQEYYDNILAAIIREIDAGVTYANSTAKTGQGYTVSQADWNIVASARNIKGYNSLTSYSAVIPSGSPAKDLAADFLRFMYSDIGIEAFSNASEGMLFPVDYFGSLSDTEYEEAVAGFEQESQDKFELIFKKGSTLIPSESTFALGRSGLEKYAYSGNEGTNMVTSGDSYKKPVDFFIDDILTYTGANYSNWESLCQLAGKM